MSGTALVPRLASAAARIDQIVAGAPALRQANSFAEEIALAQSIADLRAALTDEIMVPVMSLMNTSLGFLTDRGPQNPKNRDPYPVGVIRDCFIEAKLRGFSALGNEWNVISGRFYAAKNGLRRKVQTWPGLTDYKETIEVPRTGAGGAVVKCHAQWKMNGIPDALDADIGIKVSSEYMGVDAIVGKATRKLLARVHDRLGGVVTPEGDATDLEVLETTIAPKVNPLLQVPALAASAHQQYQQLANLNQQASMQQQIGNLAGTGQVRLGPSPAQEWLDKNQKEADERMAHVERDTREAAATREGWPEATTPVRDLEPEAAAQVGAAPADDGFAGEPLEVDKIVARLKAAKTEAQIKAEVEPIKALSDVVRPGADMSDQRRAKVNYFEAKARLGLRSSAGVVRS